MKYNEVGQVLANEQLCPGVWRMRVAAPQIAAAARPGQFAHICVADAPSVQFLRMPFAVCRAYSTGQLDICYQVVGAGTKQLSGLAPGACVDLIGPVGNGWQAPEGTRSALLVAGGVGAPAVAMLASQLAAAKVKVSAVLGAQTAGRFVCREEIGAACGQSGGQLFITTDDGTEGTSGFVTAVSDDEIASGAYDYVAVCGPFLMMRNVVKPALAAGVACQVSMEKLMACGVGACLSCVVETVNGRRRCCVDGPVFEASEVVW